MSTLDLKYVFSENPSFPFLFSLILSLIVVLFSILPLAVARYPNGFRLKSVSAPRSLFDKLSLWGKRAEWAHKNCLESFTIHSPSAILAILVTLNGHNLSVLAVEAAFLHPLFRLLYIWAYIFNISFLRAFLWGGGLGCTGILYFESSRHFF